MSGIRTRWLQRAAGLAAALGLGVGLTGAAAVQAADAPALFPIRQGELHGLIDADGRTVLPPEFTEVQRGEALIRARKGTRSAYFDPQGRLVIEPQDRWHGSFSQGVQPATGKDAQGRLRWGYVEPYSDGLALVRQDDRTLVIDREGQVVLQPQADRVWPFSDGLALVRVGRLQGYIDTQGRTVIEPQYSHARPFHHGLAFVMQGRSSAYIRTDGSTVWRSDAP